jgi:hypothetical protein
MTKFFKRTFLVIGVFIGLPLLIGFIVVVRTAIKNAPPDRTAAIKDSIDRNKANIAKAQYEERNRYRNWWYYAEEDKMTSDSIYTATAEPKVKINIRTDRERVEYTVVESHDNSYGQGYDKGYRNGYRNGQGKSISIFDNRYSSSSRSTGKKSRTTVHSTNYAPANLGFTLLKKAGNETDAYIDMGEGAFSPEYFTGQRKLRIRFDKEKATFYSVLGDKARTRRVLYISPAKEFIKKLKKANTMLVEVSIVDNGNEVLEFDVHGLVWNHPS